MSASAILLALLSAYACLEDPQGLGISVNLLATALLWAGAFPALFFLYRRNKYPTFALLPSVGLLYAVYFALPLFGSVPVLGAIKRPPSIETIPEALTLVLAGVVALLLVSLVSTDAVQRLPRPRVELDLNRAVPWLMLVSGVAAVVRVLLFGRVRMSESYAQFFELLGRLGDMSAAGLLLAYLRGYLRAWQTAYLVGVVLLVSALGLATSLIASALLSLLPLVFIYVWERRRWPVRAIFLVLLIVAPLNVTKTAFRDRYDKLLPEMEQSHSSISERLATFASVTVDEVLRGNLTADAIQNRGAERSNFLANMTYVMEATPRHVPYWEGYTYSGFAWHFVPRFLVPSKPIVNLGQEFPRRYALIDYGDDITSYNLPQIIEMYINFGPLGVLLGMSLVALIYRLVEHLAGASSGTALVGAALCSILMNVESDFSTVFGALVPHGVGLYVFVTLLPRLTPSRATA